MPVKDEQINSFGTKLMVSSRSINKIPYEHMSLAQNARIYDGGIGPRRGLSPIINSVEGTVNQGGFFLNQDLYQVANGKIYRVDTENNTRLEIVDIGYDQRIDVLTYDFPIGEFVVSETISYTYNTPDINAGLRFEYRLDDSIDLLYFNNGDFQAFDSFSGTGLNSSRAVKAARIVTTSTDGLITVGSGGGVLDPNGIILDDGEHVNVNVTPTGNISNQVTVEFGYFESEQRAIIVSNNNTLRVFNGESIVNSQEIVNNGIIEYTRGFSFLGQGNILRISAPITVVSPENAYDFTGADSQSIVYRTEILGLQETMRGLYIWNKDKVEFLGANALQNVGGSTTFISQPIGESGELMNNHCITAIGDKIFYLTKELNIETINYIEGTSDAAVGDLSARQVIGVRELLETIDSDQPYAFAHYNKREKTVNFHVRTVNSRFNDKVIVYDFINDTWAVDTNKNFNLIVEEGQKYYGFSDVNTSIYLDDLGNNDAGQPIDFKLVTQNMNWGNLREKRFAGFFTSGAIGNFSELDYRFLVDQQSIYQGSIQGEPSPIEGMIGMGVNPTGINPIGGSAGYVPDLKLFDRTADEGNVFMHGVRCQLEISSNSMLQDFLIDTLGVSYEQTRNIDINNKF